MNKQRFPAGWDEARVKRLIEHYENMTDDEIIAEDEAAHKAGVNHLPVLSVHAKKNGTLKAKPRRTKANRIATSLPPSTKRRGKHPKRAEKT